MNFNIRILYQSRGPSSQDPFLGSREKLEWLPFMADYLANIPGSSTPNFKAIDRRFARLYSNFEPTYNVDDMGNPNISPGIVLTEFQEDIFAMLVSNRNKYEKLYALTKMEYNPIENYNMVEKGIDKNGGRDTDTITDGSKTTTTEYGEHTEDTTVGTSSVTTQFGTFTSSDNAGARTDEVTAQVSGYNDPSLVDATKNFNKTGSQVTSRTENEHTDVVADTGRKDVNVSKAHTDTVTETRTPTTHVMEKGTQLDHSLTRSGNVGVTTTQQMLEQEVKFWDSFSFYKIIFDDIIKTLCNYNDVGYDTHLTPLENVIIKGE